MLNPIECVFLWLRQGYYICKNKTTRSRKGNAMDGFYRKVTCNFPYVKTTVFNKVCVSQVLDVIIKIYLLKLCANYIAPNKF